MRYLRFQRDCRQHLRGGIIYLGLCLCSTGQSGEHRWYGSIINFTNGAGGIHSLRYAFGYGGNTSETKIRRQRCLPALKRCLILDKRRLRALNAGIRLHNIRKRCRPGVVALANKIANML